MLAKDLMATKLVSISPGSSVLDAAEAMLRNHVSGLPVVDSAGDLVGMMAAGDLIRRAEIATELHRGGFAEFKAGKERPATDYVRGHGKHVSQVTTRIHGAKSKGRCGLRNQDRRVRRDRCLERVETNPLGRSTRISTHDEVISYY